MILVSFSRFDRTRGAKGPNISHPRLHWLERLELRICVHENYQNFTFWSKDCASFTIMTYCNIISHFLQHFEMICYAPRTFPLDILLAHLKHYTKHTIFYPLFAVLSRYLSAHFIADLAHICLICLISLPQHFQVN